jgi:hypothetical protein
MQLGGGDDSSGHPVGNDIVVEARGDLAPVDTRNIVSTRSTSFAFTTDRSLTYGSATNSAVWLAHSSLSSSFCLKAHASTMPQKKKKAGIA